MRACVLAVTQSLVDHVLAQVGGTRDEPGHAVDHVDDQVEASMLLSMTMSNGVVVVPFSL